MMAHSENPATPSDHGVIFARVLDGAGGATPIDWARARAWQESAPGETLWLHLDRTMPGIADWLADDMALSEATVEVLTSNETRPRAFREGDALVTILRGINFNPGAEPEDMVAMQIWADAARVVTLRRRRLQTPFDVLAALDAGQGPQSAGDLVAEIVEQMVAKMGASILEMNDQIDMLEEAGDDVSTAIIVDAISDIRRNCLALKRFMSPQHEALERIGRDAPPWLSKPNRRDIAETIDRLRRYLDDLDVSKESALVLQDDLNNRAAAQSNKTMYLLSIVAAIFLPLSFITGLLGINVGGMPGVNSHDAFWITCGALGAMLIAILAIFRRLKWL